MRLFQSLRPWLGIELIDVSATEKIVSAVGGGIAIWLLSYLTSIVLPHQGAMLVIGSMGASAVLLYAVPHGQLSQPWPVVAGHGVSALVGVTCARWIPSPPLAAACAVGLAIGIMHQLKCIHPPGGATAFTAVLAGEAVRSLGFSFVVFPVLTNALIIVMLAVIINYPFPWRRYPVVLRRSSPPPSADAPKHEEVIAAIRSLDTFVDISEEDLLQLIDILTHQPSVMSRAPNSPKHYESPPS
ncbi:MAG: HPP family protein [Verrucomicrobiaceae bacterium]|nr:HPP family protein [Verrucomicrobiaceae bacterium]